MEPLADLLHDLDGLADRNVGTQLVLEEFGQDGHDQFLDQPLIHAAPHRAEDLDGVDDGEDGEDDLDRKSVV